MSMLKSLLTAAQEKNGRVVLTSKEDRARFSPPISKTALDRIGRLEHATSLTLGTRNLKLD